MLNTYCVLGIGQCAGETVLRRAGKVLSHTDFMVHGEDARTSTMSEAITVRGSHVQSTQPCLGER